MDATANGRRRREQGAEAAYLGLVDRTGSPPSEAAPGGAATPERRADAGLALDPVIHQPTRLRILAALYRNRVLSFTGLRDGLGLTDGNLATHTAKLEEAGYLESRRVLAGVSFEVRYRITPAGSDAFRAYAAALRDFLEVAEREGADPE